jgi:hypothetical protein
MMVAMASGVALLLALAPVWATPLLVALALLPRALGPFGVLAGTLVGTALANPLASLGYQVGEALGFPFLGMWAALTIGVLAAQAVGEVAAFLAQVAKMAVLRK